MTKKKAIEMFGENKLKELESMFTPTNECGRYLTIEDEEIVSTEFSSFLEGVRAGMILKEEEKFKNGKDQN